MAAAARRTVDPETVTAIEVDAYEKAVIDLALDAEKWHPKIRESADHSLPFLVAVGLLDAGLTETSFSDDRWLHADVDELMQKVRVNVDPELTEAFPKEVSSRLRITYGDGQEVTDSVSHPLGHYLRPMPAGQVRDKFLAVAGPWIGPARADVLYELLMRLEEVQDLSEVMDLTIVNP
jgi:2-methylcitrate dehydratase